MARTEIPVDKDILIQCITEAESNGPLKNESALWNKLSELYKVKTGVDVEWGVMRLRVNSWKLDKQTKKGKRGRQSLSPEQKVAMQAGRQNREKGSKASFDAMYSIYDKKWHPVIKKAEKGNIKARVKLKCLDCSCQQPVEIRLCTLIDCSLHDIRPFQPK